jgi:UrcA family protein
MFRSTKTAALIASATLALGSTAAFAAPAGDFVSNGRTTEVYHGDLNLAKADQQKQLRGRIARAASKVCANSDLSIQMACRAKAIAQVEPRMSAAIARAETGERYADAGSAEAAAKDVRAVVGN